MLLLYINLYFMHMRFWIRILFEIKLFKNIHAFRHFNHIISAFLLERGFNFLFPLLYEFTDLVSLK